MLDSIVFDSFLMPSLSLSVLGISFPGPRRILFYILFDSSEIFTICAGLFLFKTLRREPRATLFHFIFVLLLASQILFYLGLSNDPTPFQAQLTTASNTLHFIGVASVPFFQYVVDYDKAVESFRNGQMFMFNASENVKFAFSLFNLLIYTIHWGVVFFSGAKHTYLDWTRETAFIFFIPFIVVGLTTIVIPKRLDTRMKQVLENAIIQRSNQSAELLSLTRALEIKRKGHRQLLEKLLPPRIVDELQANGKVESEHFDSCTVFFSDIVGYTRIAAQVDTVQVVFMLNQLYTLFDSILDKDSRLYKVETIGDAYMVSSGAPNYVKEEEDHASSVADMAILLHEAVKSVVHPLDPSTHVPIRVGINTGPVLGTVMGTRMPRYTLVGDTVKVANLLESTSEAGKTQISARTAELLKRTRKYVIEERGDVELPGKGVVKTYWLVSASSSHDFINSRFISSLLAEVSPQKRLGLRRQQQSLLSFFNASSNASLASTDSSRRKLRVSLLSTSPDKNDVKAKLLGVGYDCDLNKPSAKDYNVLLVDMDADNDQVDYLSILSEFRGLVIVLRSLELPVQEESELKDPDSPATYGNSPLLLYKPFDPMAFRQIVRNFHL